MPDSDAAPAHTKQRQKKLRTYLRAKLSDALDPRELRLRSDAGLDQMIDHALPLIADATEEAVRVRVANVEIDGSERTVVDILAQDQPFLVDTLRLNIRHRGLREIVFAHPVLAVERDEDGGISRLGPAAENRGRESYLYAEVPRIESAAERSEIELSLRRTYTELLAIIRDHGRMVRALRTHTADIELASSRLGAGRPGAHEIMAFLDWLADDHYVFCGYRRYDVTREDGLWTVKLAPDSGLGLVRSPDASRFRDGVTGEEIPALVRSRIEGDGLVFFDKSRTTSKIHREGRLDCVTVKLMNEFGEITGFGRFIGMLTYKAIRTNGSQIPVLRRRREQVLEAIGAAPGSHTYKAAITSFDSLPLEFLFSFDLDDIQGAVTRILRATETSSVEVTVVPDPLKRSFFVSVILPRSLYQEDLRRDVHRLLVEKYRTVYVDHRTSFVDEDVALMHFFCSCVEDVDLEMLGELESQVQEKARRWEDRFEAALLRHHRQAGRLDLVTEYAPAFPEEYRLVTSPEDAVRDVEHLERLRRGESEVEVALLSDSGSETAEARLKIYQKEHPYLTAILPTIDQFGLCVVDGTSTELHCRGYGQFWIVTFRVDRIESETAARMEAEGRVVEGLRRALLGEIERDGLNSLILGAGLEWFEVDLIRAYVRYAHQLGGAPQDAFTSQTLLRHPDATRALVGLFRARFDPDLDGDRERAQRTELDALQREREAIATAQEDRVFGLLANLIESTVRTGFFMASDTAGHDVVLKLDPRRIERIPSPRPYAEIFVHSARMSGIHLRGGAIARGGLRWSDRIQDFRTEILGLMKTQMVKNGLIVPVGSKGGFVLKASIDDPAEARRRADQEYAVFVRALLRVTDNIDGGSVRTPERVVRHDGEDPYLVVAADKGTAHLSDVANRVAEEEGFWLADAFASGGSEGYDHKAEAITARGAWICVQRHFCELGIDVENEAFTAVGIGDMSGDVFGNGLLLARRARLLAAFNHQHIFIDPDPEAEAAWAERKRLFELPRSSWRDYDPRTISPGGGVYERDARSIRLSSQARAILGLDDDDVGAEVVTGEDLVRAILKMPIDLLWNGAIGTYVKASDETHADVGDRANDGVRIDARELGARAVAEGGNLGLTQRARVEYALGGGRINTDACDNSGGVDLSDHEVNLKILLAQRCASGKMSREDRDAVLRSCVDEADAAVLRHNADQSRCISMDQMRDRADPECMGLAASFLERHGGLDPALEFLPDADEIRTRRTRFDGTGYTRPELAILLGYTKMRVKRALSASERMDDDAFAAELKSYFPASLQRDFEREIRAHRLRREITACTITNRVIDLAGVTLVPELVSALGVSVPEAIVGYYTADRLLEADGLRARIQDRPMAEGARLAALLRVDAAVREAARARLGPEASLWLDPREFELTRVQTRALREIVTSNLSETEGSRLDRLTGSLERTGLGRELAHDIESLHLLVRSLGVLGLATDGAHPLQRVLDLHRRVGAEARICWLLDRLGELERHDAWERVAAEGIALDMLGAQRRLTSSLLDDAGDGDVVGRLRAHHRVTFRQIDETAAAIEADRTPSLAGLAVLSRQIRRLS